MNKRVWSVVVALAMLLSMICSVFVVSADETQADGSEATSLKLTPSASDIVLGHEFTVDLSLDNYESNWATFTAELTYDASAVEYLGYDETVDPEVLFVSVEKNTNKLTIFVLSSNGKNISADIAADLLTLKFKATANSTNPISASFVADSVAGYLADGTSDYIAEDSYSAAAVVPQILIEKKTPYLTMQLVDKNGDPIDSSSAIKQGQIVRAIVTLNDYYDPWMAMTLSLNYDAAKFTYKDAKDLAAFVSDENGKMTMAVLQPDDTNNPLSVSFSNSASANRFLKDGKKSADILELTLVAKATAAPGEAQIGASFAEDGNMRFDPATGETVALTKDNDFLVEAAEGKGNVQVEIIEVIRPYLTLEDEDGNSLTNLKVKQGDSFTVNVKINNFHHKWSAMSLIAKFDNTVFDITESAVQNANTTPLFGDYVFPVLGNGALGVTLLSSEGDVGIDGGEGIVLKIPMKANEDADLSKAVDPIKVFFAPDGNISGGKEVDDGLYVNNKDNPVSSDVKILPQGLPSLSIQLDDSNIIVDENGTPTIKRGGSFTVDVKINNFHQKWSAMSFIAQFDSGVFEVDENALEEGENKTGVFGDYVIPVLGNGTLGVTLLSENGDVGVDGGEGIVFKIPMKAIEEADLATIKVFFAPDGNIADGEMLSSDFYLSDPENPAEVQMNVLHQGQPSLSIHLDDPNIAVDENGTPIIKQGDSFTVNVEINNFKRQAWSTMSFIAQFDSGVFEVDENALEEGENKTGVFGDYVIPVLGNGTLGVTLLSENGDVGLTDDAAGGIIFRIPMKVKENAILNGNTFPIEVSFVPEGNISKGEIVDEESYLNEPVKIDLNVLYKERPQVKIEAIQATDAEGNSVDIENDNLKAGDKVQFKVYVENFIDAWSIMTLQVGFNSNIFKPVLVSDEFYATDLTPFDLNKAESADAFSQFFTYADNGELSAFWLNSENLPMYDSKNQEVMIFTLEVNEGYTLTNGQIDQSISVKFHPDGNHVGEEKLEGSSDSNGGGDFVSDEAVVTVKVEPSEAPSVLVEISWGAMEFTYSYGKWDTEELIWDGAGWNCDADANANKITVTNKGEVDVTAAFEFTPVATGVSGTFYDADDALIKGTTVVKKATEKDAYLKLEQQGDPTQEALGTIKVTIDIKKEDET